MTYLDRDLLVATQIAYYDFKAQDFTTTDNKLTLRELLLQDDTEIKKLMADSKRAIAKGSPLEKKPSCKRNCCFSWQ